MTSNPIYTDFITKLMSCKDVRPDAAEYFTEDWFIKSMRKPKTHPEYISSVDFSENINEISKQHFEYGYGAERIAKNVFPEKHQQPESLRRYIKLALRDRTPEEKSQRKISFSLHQTKHDLFGAEDEIIRLYKSGVSLERLLSMFSWRPATIKSILVDDGCFYDSFYMKQNKNNGNKITSDKSKERTDDERNEIHEKQQKHRFYEYTMPSGNKINIQGYEKYSLDDYFKSGGMEENVNIRRSFKYELDGKQKRYYADMVLIDTGKIIETKSLWTLKKEINKNLVLMKTFLDRNIPFEFWVYTRSRKRTILSSVEEVKKFLHLQ